MKVSTPFKLVFSALTLVLSGSALPDALTPSQLQQFAQGADTDVIVILRDQVPSVAPARGAMAARASALASAQVPILSELQQAGATKVRSFRLINAVATTVSKAEIARLAAHPLVQAVMPDLPIRANTHGNSPLSAGSAATAATAGSAAAASASATGLCNTLEPEALQLTNTAFTDPGQPQAQQLRDGNGQLVAGNGVKVAFIADGLDPNISGFTRPDGSPVFFDFQNFSGDPAGTPTPGGEAFGDASSIAAQDTTFDISQFVNAAHPLPSPCNIRIRGMAPGASLAGLKVFSSLGLTRASVFIQAIEWAVVDDDVDVINESFGSAPFPDNANSPLALANTAAVRAGVTVVVSSGDAGSAGTLGSPATDTDVIAVGATTQYRLYAQTASRVIPLSSGGYLDNNISPFSSGGFSQSRARTVDVVAPGDLGWALCSTNTTLFTDCVGFNGKPSPIEDFGGTSESAPLTAGEAALVIQAYRSTHGGQSPTPALVKRIIMSTATDLGAPAFEQGAGLINSLAAVNAALSVDARGGFPRAQGQSVLNNPTSANATALPQTPEMRSFTVTNTGTATQHLSPTLQTLGAPVTGDALTLTLNPSTDPTFLGQAGVRLPFIEQTFTVPAGVQHLDAAIAFQTPSSTSPTPVVFLALLDPLGRQATYSIPQGLGSGYGHVDVVAPAAGIWTAVIGTNPASRVGSYAGPVQFTWSVERYVRMGSVWPEHLELRPGESAEITARFEMPATPGDMAAAIRFLPGPDTNNTAHAAIPVTLRTLVPLGETGGSFTGTLTGGNGRPNNGPTQTFAFDVPSSAKNMSLGLDIADSGYLLEGLLVDPQGMQLSVQPNIDPSGGAGKSLQLFRYNPQPGRWRFVLLQDFTASGNQTSLPFTARISFFDTEQVAVSALPGSADVKLSASGAPLTVPVQVTNNGGSTEWYFADARLTTPAVVQLTTGAFCASPTLQGACELAIVPPEVTAVGFLAQSPAPIDMAVLNETGFNVGVTKSPDLWARPVGNDSVEASLFVPEVPYGLWVLFPSLVGPYGPGGAPTTVPVSTSAVALMQPFDPAVSSDTGNLWKDIALGTGNFNPLVLSPGQSGTINVTITPDPAQVGNTISGFLYIDTFNPAVTTGDEVVRIPYRYTVVP
jgi:hypothetical protein